MAKPVMFPLGRSSRATRPLVAAVMQAGRWKRTWSEGAGVRKSAHNRPLLLHRGLSRPALYGPDDPDQ